MKKRRIMLLIITGLVVVASCIISLFVYQSALLHVIEAEPSDGGTLNVGSSIFIEFSEAVKDSATVSSSPEFGFAKKIDGTRLIITPIPNLIKNRSYTLTISGVHALNDSAMSGGLDYKLHFTTGIVPFDKLPPSQYKEQTSTIDSQYKKSPILSVLPIVQLDFSIVSDSVGDKLYVVVTPTVSPTGKTEQEYTAQYSTYYNEAVAYLKDKGYEKSDNYTIISDQDFRKLPRASGD